MKTFPGLLQLVGLTLFLLAGCAPSTEAPPWLTGEKGIDRKLSELSAMLAEQEGEVQRYGLMEQIISLYRRDDHSRELKLFLGRYLHDYPEDSYNGYYLLMLGSLYEEEGALETADIYYERLLTNYDDLIIKGRSVHLFGLNKLLARKPAALREIDYYRELLDRFSADIDKGLILFRLARAYEKEGLWEQSIQSYRKFLEAPTTTIPGEPNVYNEVDRYLKFHDSTKDWTRQTLDGLVNSIKYAIRTRSSSRLSRYMAEDFFMMSWGQDRYDPFTQIPMELSYFLKASVWYNRNLEAGSNDEEAFLRTGGWSYRINIWYLYFNRIRYPIDPEINGRWEWAGIYFGDRL